MAELRKRLRQEAPLAVFYVAALLVAITLSILTHRGRVTWAEGYLVWAVPTVLGVLAGQFAFFLRLRTWLVLAAAFSWFVAAYYGFPYLLHQEWFPGKGDHPFFADGIGPAFLWYLALWTPLFSLGGLFSLRRPWGVLACWFPTVFFIKATIPFINLDQEWLEGRKWTVWTPGTLLVVIGCVGLFLFFLAWRERRRISQWSGGRKSWRLQGGGRTVWRRAIEAVLLVMVLSASTALISPFLWNRIRNTKGTEIRQGQAGSEQNPGGRAAQNETGPSGRSEETAPAQPGDEGQTEPQQNTGPDREDRGRDVEETQTPPRDDQAAAGSDQPRDRGRPQPSGASGEATPEEESAGEGADSESSGGGAVSGAAQRFLPWLLLILLWALLRRPVERLRLVRSWLDPQSRESPTQRVDHAWRAVQTVLEDYGRLPRPSETPEAFCRRLHESWPALAAPLKAAADVATIRDRVFFSLFVQPGDVEESRRLAADAYRTLWDRQGFWHKVQSLYRDLSTFRT